MKGATVSDLMEYLKKLIPAKLDKEVASFLGVEAKALSQAKQRGNITNNLWAATSSALNLTVPDIQQDLDTFIEGKIHKCSHDLEAGGQSKIYWDAWQQALAENRRLQLDKDVLYREKEALYREKESLMVENAELKVTVARLEERLMMVEGGGYPGTSAITDKPVITIENGKTRAAG